ncbi:MAG TPA: MFS transporter [Tepidisphaeraceae bacterium]
MRVDDTAVVGAPISGVESLDRRYVTAAMCLVMALASMEQTVTATAMPTIIAELHGLEHYSWVASIYLLACTVSMPLYGRLADALGRKPVILFAISLFCIASVFASAAHSMGQLILFRGLQGLGAGGIMPLVLTILADIFTLEERASIQGFFSGVWGIASLAGPALGAFLVNTLGWRSVFYVNLPFAAIGLTVLVWKYHDHEKPHSTDLDLPGVSLLAIACAATLALVSRLGPEGWTWPVAIVLLIIALAAFTLFISNERRSPHAIMPPSLILRRAIGPSLIASFMLGVGFLCLDTYVPLFVQGARGGGAGAAASVVTPVILTWALSGLFAAPLVVRWGFRRTAILGSCLIVLSFIGLVACAVAGAPSWLITIDLLITGLGLGPSSMAYLLAAQNSVEWQQRGIVTSSIAFCRTMGGAVGIGVMGMLFNLLTWREMSRLREAGLNPAALMNPHLRATASEELVRTGSQSVAHGLTWVFAAMLAAAVVQLLATLAMPKSKSDHTPTASEALEGLG